MQTPRTPGPGKRGHPARIAESDCPHAGAGSRIADKDKAYHNKDSVCSKRTFVRIGRASSRNWPILLDRAGIFRCGKTTRSSSAPSGSSGCFGAATAPSGTPKRNTRGPGPCLRPGAGARADGVTGKICPKAAFRFPCRDRDPRTLFWRKSAPSPVAGPVGAGVQAADGQQIGNCPRTERGFVRTRPVIWRILHC